MSDYGPYGTYTPPPTSTEAYEPYKPPTVTGTRSVREGDYVVTYTKYSDGHEEVTARVYTPLQKATTSTAETPTAAPATSTPPGGAPVSFAPTETPPAGANPDEEELIYENGRMVRRVYKYTANGHRKGDIIKDYSGMWGKLDTVSQAPDFKTWLSQTGYGGFAPDVTQTTPYQGMTDLIAKLQDPNLPAADRQAALDQLAKERGYAGGTEYNAAMNQRLTGLEAGVGAQQGMTDAEKLAYQKLMAGQTQELETQQRKQLDAIMSGQTGNSTARALMQANENIKTIRDAQLQSTVSLMNMDYTRKLDSFDRNLQLYKDAMDRGEMTVQNFMQAFKDNRLSALQGFATQTSTILQQNQEYLNMYGADLDKIRTNADIVYQQIQVELGIDEAGAQATRDAFDKWAAETGLEMQKQQIAQANNQAIFSGILSFIGLVLLIIL